MNDEKPCPRCSKLNTDNKILDIDGIAMSGGCLECWEAECADEWWRIIEYWPHGQGYDE
jgi:hypothetical protein